MVDPQVLEVTDVWPYLVRRGLLPADATGQVREVGDGNMNRVFVATPADTTLPGLAVKQAPPWIRRLGPGSPMSPERALVEARALATFARYAPEQTPRVLDVDPELFAFTMEDLSDLQVLRTALDAGAELGSAAREVGELVGEVSFATGVAGSGAADRAALLAASVNPLLAQVTEQYLLGDPFLATAEHNHHHRALDADLAALRADPRVRTAVSRLRVAFGSSAQSLVHGDLHSGSVMVGVRDGVPVTRVIDPEFAVVGPVGLDLGLFVANLVVASLRAAALGDPGRAARHAAGVQQCWDAFAGVWADRFAGRTDTFLDDGWLAAHLADVWDDTLGFAAVELVRRVGGYSHASDLDTLPDPGPASGAALSLAHRLLLDRTTAPDVGALAGLVTARGVVA